MQQASSLTSIPEGADASRNPSAPAGVFAPSSVQRRFQTAPQSVTGFVAALLEPTLSIGVLYAAHMLNGVAITHASVALMLLVMLLTFPGKNRFLDRPLVTASGIVGTWLLAVAQMLVCGWATGSFGLYDERVLLDWAVASPAAQWFVVMFGGEVLRRQARARMRTRKAIIVGAGALASSVARALSGSRDSDTRVLGCFDDRSGPRIDVDAARHLLGPLSAVAGYVRQHGIADVYITLPLSSQPRIVALLEDLQGTTASLYLVPDLFGVSVIQGRLHDVNGLPVVGLCETPFTGVNAAAKRITDIALSSVILVLLSLPMALIALGVKLTSPGPALFRQRRNGLGGEEIVVYKFRTMRAADDGAVVPQARRGDPRITPLGAWLRRTSLDELPQFINVLQGRMSIVGPRPHAVAHNHQYAQLIKAYMVRHKVRPGITGWAQVNGHRGETSTLDKMRARVECDLDYLRNWSMGLDFHIMARTVRLMLGDRNAY